MRHRDRFALSRLFTLAIAATFVPMVGQAQPSDDTLLSGAGITVTAQDLRSEMASIPEEAQLRLLASAPQLRQFAGNIYVRRAAAQAASQQGLDKNPAVRYRLQMVHENTLGEEWVKAVDASVQPTPEQLETYARSTYKAEPQRFAIPAQNHARHILIMGKTPENRTVAENLLAQLKDGADFEDLAKKQSQDPGSAAKGGDLGWFPKGRMVKEFDEAVQALQKPGELSGVVESQFGYHIIRLEDRKSATERPYEEVREQLQAEARNKLIKDARAQAIGKLEAQAKGDATALDNFITAEKAKRN